MDRQHNGQTKKNKMTNKDLQNITQKTKDRATQTPIKTGDELRCSEGKAVAVVHMSTVMLLLLHTW